MKHWIPMMLMVCGLCSFMTPEQKREWVNHFKTEIEAVGEDPTIEQLRTLAHLVASDSESEEANEIRVLAWQRLQAIPDFPERMKRGVLASKERWKSGKMWVGDYLQSTAVLYHMGNLPHPGCVRVLGGFLDDDEWPSGDNLEAKLAHIYPTCLTAIKALGQLIDKPPLQKNREDYTMDDVAIWRLWYEQVKAGTRTFRFKGNPQEYTLAGPVSEARVPGPGTPSVPAKPFADAKAEATDQGKLPLGWLLAALALCAGGVWRVFRSRKRNAANF